MMNEQNIFATMIAKELTLPLHGVENTLKLLADGCTIPFIARYRKEKTGGLDEVQIAHISDLNDKYTLIQKRKDTIISTIDEQGKLTPELKSRINECWEQNMLEDIYLPYKPKRRTRAQVAREQGLEPLARLIMLQRESDPERAAALYIKGDVKDAASAMKGAQDIIAEDISENETTRQNVRAAFRREATITSKVIKSKADSDEAQKYSDYFDWNESLRHVTSHRLLAMRRGEAEGILRVSISPDDDSCIEKLQRYYVRGNGQCSTLVGEAVEDSYKRLIKPSIETEFSVESKAKADDEAINVFTQNLHQLLMDAPLGQKRVMGIDPGFRTGCKVVCLDAQGNLLYHTAIFPHPPVHELAKAAQTVTELIRKYRTEAIAIGNGTASRETSSFIKMLNLDESIKVFVVSEDGASIYSASQIARDEFPDEDVTVRGAVSIGRRLMDPLAELVKIDPKSIGVGQYQHDVDQAKLKHSLDQTVESCVNSVGVNLNTASSYLLTYISGLGPSLAKNITEYRAKNGAFTSRTQLKKVPRLGDVAFQQCAGFLRIPNAKNPLDNSAVHPESYSVVESMAKDEGCTVTELIGSKEKRQHIDLNKYVDGNIGMPTLNDIIKELDKPGRDPRSEIEEFEFDANIKTVDDLVKGMELNGIITNITNFGAFVDIGVHQDGLVHISQLADKFVKDPNSVVKLHQHVRVRVLEIDGRRHRISLTMRGVNN
jgi:uncharacterized protein